MSAAELQVLLDRNGWTPRDLARVFAISVDLVYHWRSGYLPVPARVRPALRLADGRDHGDLVMAIAATAALARERGLDQIAAALESLAIGL